jgi:hypothetical protein
VRKADAILSRGRIETGRFSMTATAMRVNNNNNYAF